MTLIRFTVIGSDGLGSDGFYRLGGTVRYNQWCMGW